VHSLHHVPFNGEVRSSLVDLLNADAKCGSVASYGRGDVDASDGHAKLSPDHSLWHIGVR